MFQPTICRDSGPLTFGQVGTPPRFWITCYALFEHPWFENKGRQGVWMAIIAASIYGHLMVSSIFRAWTRVRLGRQVTDTLGATWQHGSMRYGPHTKIPRFPLFPQGEKMSRINKMSDEQAEQK